MTIPPRRWLAVYLVMLLLIFGGGCGFFYQNKEEIHVQVKNQLDSIARLKIGQIRQWRAERLGDGQIIVDTPFAAELVSRWCADPSPENAEPLLAWFRSLQKNYQYSDIILLDTQGRVRLSLSGHAGPVHHDLSVTLDQAVAAHMAMFSNLHRNGQEPPHQDVVAPLFLRDGEQEELVAVVVLRIDASAFLYPMLQTWPVESRSAETLLVCRDGADVLFLNELRHRRDTALRLRIPVRQDDLPAAMVLSNGQGEMDGSDYRGVEVIAVGYPIADTPWFMVSKIDTAEALAQWYLHAVVIVTLTVLVMLVLTAVLATAWQHSRKKVYKAAYYDERERRQAEARYRTILMSVGDGVIVCDTEARVQLLNPVAEVLTGWLKEDAVGRPVTEVFRIVNEDTRQPVENPVTRVLREGVVVGLANHTILITPDDTEYPIADSGAPIFDEQGDVTGVVLVFRDQTKERLADAKLRRNARMLERAEEVADMGCWEFDFSTRTVWASPSARRIYGMNGETWTIEEVQRIPLSEERPALNRALKALIQGKAPYDIEFRIRRPSDGALVHIRSQAEYNPEDNKVFGIIQDISQRKEAESTLRESEARYRSLFQNNHAVMWLIDPATGNVVDANPAAARFYGWSREELLDKNITEINMLSLEEVHAAMEDARREQRHVFAFRHRLADGSIRDVEVISGPIVVEGEERLYSIVQDVSERRKAEEQRQRLQEQLLQAQKLESVGRLAGGVAHDLNNLLSPILGYSEMLQADLQDYEKYHNYAEIIFQAGMRARNLVRQLLAFGRKQTLVVQIVDLNEVVRAFLPLLHRTVREDIHLALDLSSSLARVRVDVGQIEQVVMNLVVNAQDAMPDGGEIVLETDEVFLDQEYADKHADVQPGPHVRLTVSDTGCGMSDAVREQIFTPFYTTKKEGQGTGLGLSTTYGIVKQHGGHIWVYSEVNQGTTFKIYLPVADAAGGGHGADAATAAPGEMEESVAAATVMVVEDNAMVRELAADILSRKGYTVLTAEGGGDCLEQLTTSSEPIDLLLTDVVMPGMNGKALYQEAVGLRPGLKVVYMSGYTENVIASRGVLERGIHFIQKPFTPKALLAKVREVLQTA